MSCRNLLGSVPGEASREEYVDAVTRDNCLGKRTAATRQHSLQRLTELYGLDGRFAALSRAQGFSGDGSSRAGLCFPSF